MNSDVDGMGPVQPDAHLSPNTRRNAGRAAAMSSTPASSEHDALLHLLNNCVTAMQMLDMRMADLETKARNAVEASVRERSESRADTAILRTRTKLTESALDQMQLRIAACEAGAAENAAIRAGDLQAARAEADSWRGRTECGIAAIETRVVGVEARLERRLLEAEADIALARSHAANMEERAARSEDAAETLKDKLGDAVTAIAEQRARIACLQAKLGAATQTSRYADRSTALAEDADEAGDVVIDLRDLAAARHPSAA